ncbi:MAG TPA: hypothetical protein PKV72_00605 [Candidatus Peribacteria bacterium]|nr:hypothetical protein [Candidatus Peribacteria bacterium]
MSPLLRTIGITIACAVVILAANASIYANNPGAKQFSHQEAQQTTNVLHVVVYRNS